jgi:hypothetical protein
MLAKVEDRVIDLLKRRQNKRRYGVSELTVQDCMDFLHVLSQRIAKIEERIKQREFNETHFQSDH